MEEGLGFVGEKIKKNRYLLCDKFGWDWVGGGERGGVRMGVVGIVES